jgi:hypothetical protein
MNLLKSNNTLKVKRSGSGSLIHSSSLHQFDGSKFQHTDADPTKELDKGRGARTTSIKPLSTLIPLIMSFNCREPFYSTKYQTVPRYKEEKHITNCIIMKKK